MPTQVAADSVAEDVDARVLTIQPPETSVISFPPPGLTQSAGLHELATDVATPVG